MTACARLIRAAWGIDRLKLALALGLVMLQAAAIPVVALTFGLLTDRTLRGDGTGAAVAALCAALGIMAHLSAGHLAHVLYFELGEQIFLDLDLTCARALDTSPTLEPHESPSVADRIEILRTELERVSWLGIQAVMTGCGLAVGMLTTGFLLARISPWLLALPATALPAIWAVARAEALMAAARNAAAVHERQARHLFELASSTGSAAELKAGGAGPRIAGHHAAAWNRASARLDRGEIRAALVKMAGESLFCLGYLAATVLVAGRVLAGQVGVGDLILTVLLALQVNGQMATAVSAIKELRRLGHTLDHLAWLDARCRAPTEAPSESVARRPKGIELESLRFSYPDSDATVLDDVNLYLPAGTVVAFVGENGAGKSSLVKLLCGFYRPTQGTVRIDGVDMEQLDVRAWQQEVSAVFQDAERFEFIVREAVGMGDLTARWSREAVQRAIEVSGAATVVDKLKNGIDSPVGQSLVDGAELSGGQWQSLALARGSMRSTPRLLVLDEPTSALDPAAEAAVFARFVALSREARERDGTVTVLVSHRFGTVRAADLIVVLDEGRVVETGTHEGLMKQHGRYHDLFDLQARQYS
ncbi:ATP-binding cassette domain-containing protein [Actinomadura sp. B10D3]|uniref:ABC transporter ATP-binding protein n=1 Tax=Actinomadura sp. B10D3 TaxID=3153557 RepID=UPI00325CC01A